MRKQTLHGLIAEAFPLHLCRHVKIRRDFRGTLIIIISNRGIPDKRVPMQIEGMQIRSLRHRSYGYVAVRRREMNPNLTSHSAHSRSLRKIDTEIAFRDLRSLFIVIIRYFQTEMIDRDLLVLLHQKLLVIIIKDSRNIIRVDHHILTCSKLRKQIRASLCDRICHDRSVSVAELCRHGVIAVGNILSYNSETSIPSGVM